MNADPRGSGSTALAVSNLLCGFFLYFSRLLQAGNQSISGRVPIWKSVQQNSSLLTKQDQPIPRKKARNKSCVVVQVEPCWLID